MQAYEAERFDPPAPLAYVSVKSLDSGSHIHDIPMLLDSGADVSLLPRDQFSSFIVPGDESYELESFDGTKTFAPAVRAELMLLGKSFRGRFLLIDGWHGILGRNILNNLKLFFDGPTRIWGELR